MWTVNFQMFKLVLEKAVEPEIKLPLDHGKSNWVPEKHLFSALLTMPRLLTVWITTNCGKFFKRWEYQTPWSASWEIHMQVRKQVKTGHGMTDWFQIGKGVRQGCMLSPCLFNLDAEYIMRNAGWMKHKLESRFSGKISITSDRQMTPPLWQKAKKN